jgi:EmrB/QacA subfamily drug resistance transporter
MPHEKTPLYSEKIDPKIWRTVCVVLLGPFMTQIDSTVVNVSLSTIRDQLHSSIASAQWIISGYLLALALMLPINGWLVDRVGAKRLYLVCFTAFTLASLLCGSAHTMDSLVFARVIQGIAGGLLAPMTVMMIARVAGKQMARVMGYSTVPVLLAPLLGPIIAGAILKYASWPWLFYLNLPVGFIAVILAAVLLPNDQDSVERRPFDLAGFLFISPGLACFLYGLEKAPTPVGVFILFTGLGLLGLFIAHARRKKKRALIDLDLFKNKIFAAATVTQFLSNAMIYAGQLIVPLYLITGCAFSPSQVGFILLPMGIGMLCSYPLMGHLTEKFGCRAVSVTGAFLVIGGTLPLLWMSIHHYSALVMMICLFARGAGQGGIGLPSSSAAYASIPKKDLGIAATALNIVQRIGGPIATTVMAMVMAFAGVHAPAHSGAAFTIPFAALIGIQILVLIATTRLPLLMHPETPISAHQK